LFPHGFTDGFTLECYDFVDAIQNNRPPEVTAEDGLKAKAIAIAIYEAATTGKTVRVADVLNGEVEVYQRPSTNGGICSLGKARCCFVVANSHSNIPVAAPIRRD
jgi:hypothetical protein